MGLRHRYKYFGSILTQVYSKMSRCPICTQRAAGADLKCVNCRLLVHGDPRCSNHTVSYYSSPRPGRCSKCAEESAGGP